MSTLRREHVAKEVQCKIGKFTILPEHILDYEMTYSIDSILPQGYIIIADAIRMQNQEFQNGNRKLTLDITDANDKQFSAEFTIIGGKHIREKKKDAAIKLELMEEESLKLSNLFWGKGYAFSTVQGVLSEILDKIKGTKTLDLEGSTALQNFAIPANKPFVQTIEYFRQKYKYYIYRTKKSFVCRDMNTILLSGTGEYDLGDEGYGIRQGNYFYYNAIKDMEIGLANRKKVNLTLPESKTYINNLMNKSIKAFDYGFSEAYYEIPTPGGGAAEIEIPSGDFKKVLMRDESAQDTITGYHFRTLQDLNYVSIVVSSNVDLEVGSIVDMEIEPAGGSYNKNIAEQFYRGKWLVHTITEKLVNKYPVQKIKLIKPKS